MSPEDDLQTQRVPAINDIPLNRGWKSISQSDEIPPNGNNHTNSSQRSQQESPLLLNNGDHRNHNILNSLADSENERNHIRSANNNEWDSGGNGNGTNDAIPLSANKPREMKNGWKEVPQHETTEPLNGGNGVALKKNGNGNGAMINGAAGGNNGVHSNGPAAISTVTDISLKNGHSDKLAEQDPLTGIHHQHHKEVDDDEMSTCGIGACQPKWATMFSSTHTFMIVFLLAWVLQVSSSQIEL